MHARMRVCICLENNPTVVFLLVFFQIKKIPLLNKEPVFLWILSDKLIFCILYNAEKQAMVK